MKKETKTLLITLVKIVLLGISIFGFFWNLLFSTFDGLFLILREIFTQTHIVKDSSANIRILYQWAFFLLGLGTILSLIFPRRLKYIVALMLLIFLGKAVYVWVDPEERAREAKIAHEIKEEQNYHQTIAPWVEKLKTHEEAVKVAGESKNAEKIKLAKAACEQFLKTIPAATFNYANREEVVNSCVVKN